jgi:hypothetical protein
MAARVNADCSVDLHRKARILELRLAGSHDALAQAVYRARRQSNCFAALSGHSAIAARAQSPGYEDCRRHPVGRETAEFDFSGLRDQDSNLEPTG